MAVLDERWSESIAVGSRPFVERVKDELGFKAAHRDVVEADGHYALREAPEIYAANFSGQTESLSSENTILWSERGENTEPSQV